MSDLKLTAKSTEKLATITTDELPPIIEVDPKLFTRTHPKTPGDDIVITGISGKFPNAKNTEEFKYNLYNKIDMLDDTDTRWRHFNDEIPKRSGKISGVENFDATFFGVHSKQAQTMDPQGRLLIETAYEAILDAGINPKTLRGSRTGVYVSAGINESEKTWLYENLSTDSFGITGCSRAMLANRISYCFGLNGPSYFVDTACSSSLYALDCAFTAIRNGECDAALVGGSNLLLHPYVSLQFARMGALSQNGMSQPFDNDAKGYVRSEAVSVIFLQKAKDAKRVYASVLYSKTNSDGYKAEGITYPSGEMQQQLITEFYDEIGINPISVAYIEAHGTGTLVGDPIECNGLYNTFCKGRVAPLLIGSVKSNMGHAEPASGVCSLTKAIFAYETEYVAPNINLREVRADIPSLVDGRMYVCTEPTKLDGSLIAINSFGFGGANAHTLLKRNPKEKLYNGAPRDKLPRLVNWAGRTEEAMTVFYNALQSKPMDIEYISLLNNIHKDDTPGYMYRGYGIYSHVAKSNAECLVKEYQHFTGIKRPIVWFFSGMGSQWSEMGTSLLQLPIFKKSVLKCHEALKPMNLDLMSIITSPDPTTFGNVLHSFVGIAAIQIGLVDILRALNVPVDNIIGHSVGELGCAYADDCLTAEQMILAAYSRGMVSLETETLRGSMAAVRLGHNEIKDMIPPEIQIACHNAADSSTISGPENIVGEFVINLKKRGVFAKQVSCAHIAFHSKYIQNMGPNFLTRLNKIIPTPKLRSPKWLSTSVPKELWDTDLCKYNSPEYHANNLLSSVLFEETSALLPRDAIIIEIAPHGLFQAILKESMPNALYIPLTQKRSADNLLFFLKALGKLFLAGINIPIEQIYPPIEYPVSRGTPMISPLIKWEHSEDWYVTKFDIDGSNQSGERKVQINLSDPDFEYIEGHTIDERCLFPATAYLHLVWETFALMKGLFYYNMNVEFEDIRFLRATSMTKGQSVNLTIMIHIGTGKFEISEGTTAICTGSIIEMINDAAITKPQKSSSQSLALATLKQEDFYKELRIRGYHYKGEFKAVCEASFDGGYGKIKWQNNWVSFLDCMLQIGIIAKDSRSLFLPTRIQKIKINTKAHLEAIANLNPNSPYFEVYTVSELSTIVSGGIEIIEMSTEPVSRRKQNSNPTLEIYKFIPHLPAPKLSMTDAIRVCVQLSTETNPTAAKKLKIVEFDADGKKLPILQYFDVAIVDLPYVTCDLTLLTAQNIELPRTTVLPQNLSSQLNSNFIISSNCHGNLDFVEQAQKCMAERGFLLSRENTAMNADNLDILPDFQLLCVIPTNEENLFLYQRINKIVQKTASIVHVSIRDKKYDWLEKLRNAVKIGATILVAQNEKLSGIIGLVNCLRKEPEGDRITCVFIDDKNAPEFNLDSPFYKNQLKLGLAINVYRNGQWGSYRHLKLTQTIEKQSRRDYCFANILQKGDFSTLNWIQGSLNGSTTQQSDIINIQYAALNFRDIMLASGRLGVELFAKTRLEQQCVLGFEYSGVNKKGEKIMGSTISGAMASHVVNTNLSWKVPENWTLQEAATCPIVYLTVYSALFLHNPISKGKSILIHAGSGGVGLAAIRVALAYGLDVFTTVSNAEKKKFVMETFPKLKENNIGNSRDCSFESMIKYETNGKGVDYVLNSLSDDKLQASIRCLGQGGTFLEIGKFDLANDSKIGLGIFLKEIIFRSVLVDNLCAAPADEVRKITNMVANDLQNGIIQPLKSTVFDVNELEKAYRYLATGKHVGKVLIKVRENSYDEWTAPMKVLPRVYFDPNLVYIVPGGLGGFGLELIDWMVVRGARQIVISSKRGITNAYQSYRIRIWESYKCKVIVSNLDISTRDGCETLLKETLKFGDIAGIFNLAMLLKDSILQNQTPEKFIECMAPKAMATKYLDEYSRKMCPNLKYFVIFSSVVCGRGNAGQSNYGMANSVMERIIEQRMVRGLPAKAIQWGGVGEVGVVSNIANDNLFSIEIAGSTPQRLSSCLEQLDILLTTNDPIVGCSIIADKTQIIDKAEVKLFDRIINILGIRDANTISMNATLSDVGMDSLIAVEIKQTLEREYEVYVTPQNLRALTFTRLIELTNERDSGKDAKIKLDDKKSGVAGAAGFNFITKNLWNENLLQQNIIRMKTLKNMDKFNSCVLMTPGVEGITGHLWDQLAAAINHPAYLLQYGNVIDKTSISDIVSVLISSVTVAFHDVKYFNLIGYSFGSLITFEFAKILEAFGKTGNIIIIDGGPSFLKKLCYGHVTTAVTDEIIENTIFEYIIKSVFPNENLVEMNKKIVTCSSVEEKFQKLIDIGKMLTEYAENYLKMIIPALFYRIRIMFNLDVDKIVKIRSPITLIRPTERAVNDIDENYELNRYTNGKVKTIFIEGNHTTIMENDKLPQIINETFQN